MRNDISGVINKIKDIGGKKIRFIILFGSAAKGTSTGFSDIDIAVFYDGERRERFEFRTRVLGRVPSKFDIQTFQDLPLYIQKDILATGKVIYYRNYKDIFDIYMKTIKEFEDFKPRLELYYSGLGV